MKILTGKFRFGKLFEPHFTMSKVPVQLQRRLLREYKKVSADKSQSFSVSIDGDNICKWSAAIFGAKDTDWDGAVLRLKIEFPLEYPHKCPDVKFESPIPFHPNVYQNGKICIDLLQHNWSNAYEIDAVITSIQALLVDPNPASPANATAAALYTDNRAEYVRVVRKCVESTWATEEKKE